LALLVVVAAPVGGVPGMRQVVAQAAAWELHVIKQVVTAEVCASRIFALFSWSEAPGADTLAANASTAQQINRTANRLVRRAMTASPRRCRTRLS
jgi:hypothetical protein